MSKESTIKKLKGLKQYKDKTDVELDQIAEDQMQKSEIIDNLSFCLSKEEKEFAQNLLKKYTEQASIESASDLDTLRSLIDTEVLAERMKALLNAEYEKANPAIPLQMVERLGELNNQIIDIKEKLGLTKTNRDDLSWIQHWNKLEKKCLNYYKEHAAETYTKCPKCQNIYRLLMKVDDKEKVSATFFKGTKIYNKKLFSLYHEKRLTDKEVAEILGTSIPYIDYIYNEVFLQDKE